MLNIRKSCLLSLIALLPGAPAWAATPASGDLTDEARELTWSGDGPYLFTNLTPQLGVADLPPVCDELVPFGCDIFTLNVNISDAFRDDEANKRETVKVGITFPQDPAGQVDYDLYIYDAAGTEVGQSADGAPQTSETVNFPLKTLKNGTYSVKVIVYTPFGTDYEGAVNLGDKPAAAAPALSINPQIGLAPLPVSFDATGMNSTGQCTFDFGDGSEPAVVTTARVEHVYEQVGDYTARVRCADPAGAKVVSAAQPVSVLSGVIEKGSGNSVGGAFGFAALLGLFGIALRRRARQLVPSAQGGSAALRRHGDLIRCGND